MSPSDDKRLETFLKENRPLHPRHSEREADKIWAQISKPKENSFWKRPALVPGVLAFASVLIVVMSINLRPTTPSISHEDDIVLVEESLDLETLENGELYEVTDLLSLAK
jgi:hypothetical protein